MVRLSNKKYSSSIPNQWMTSYAMSWRHSWRQAYIRSISGTILPRTSILVSISGFSRSGYLILYISSMYVESVHDASRQVIMSCLTSWRDVMRHALILHTWNVICWIAWLWKTQNWPQDQCSRMRSSIDRSYMFDVKRDVMTWRKATCIDSVHLKCNLLDCLTRKTQKLTPRSMF